MCYGTAPLDARIRRCLEAHVLPVAIAGVTSSGSEMLHHTFRPER